MPTVTDSFAHHGIYREIYDDNTYRDFLNHPSSGAFYPDIRILSPFVYNNSYFGLNSTQIYVEYNGDINNLRYKVDGGAETNFNGQVITLQNLSEAVHEIEVYDNTIAGSEVTATFRVDDRPFYGVKWRLQFNPLTYPNRAGFETQYETTVDILEAEYFGPLTEVCGQGQPVVIEHEDQGKQDVFQPIKGSRATIRLLAETDEQFIELMDAADGQYVVRIYNTGSDFVFTGSIEPQNFVYRYGATPYPVTITAVDTLAKMKDMKLEDRTGYKFRGKINVWRLINYAILEHNYTYEGAIRADFGIFPTNASQDNKLKDTWIDLDDWAGEDISLYDLISEILKSLRMRISKNGRDYWIKQIQKEVSGFDRYLQLSMVADIDQVSVGQTAIKTLGNPGTTSDFYLSENNATISFQRAAGKVIGTFKYNRDLNIAEDLGDNDSFLDGSPVNWIGDTDFIARDVFQGEVIDVDSKADGYNTFNNIFAGLGIFGLSAELIAQDRRVFSKVYRVKKSTIANRRLQFDFSFQVKTTTTTGVDFRLFCEVIVGDLHLTENGSWASHVIRDDGTETATQAITINKQGDVNDRQFSSSILSEPIDFSIGSLEPSQSHVEDVEIMVRFFNVRTENLTDTMYPGTYIKELSLKLNDEDLGSSTELISTFNNPNSFDAVREIEFEVGSTLEYTGFIGLVRKQFYDDFGDPVTDWTRRVGSQSELTGYQLIENTVNGHGRQYQDNRRIFKGSVIGRVDMNDLISFDNYQWIPTRVSYDVKRQTSNVTLVQLSDLLV